MLNGNIPDTGAGLVREDPLRFIVVLAAAALGSAALAAPRADSATKGVVADLVACKAIADDAARLGCYDKAAGRLAEATAKGDVKILDREDLRETRRSLFGFDLPKLPFFKGDDTAADAPEVLDTVIRSVQPAGYGKFVLTMEDGAVWQATEPLPRDPKPGVKVRLKKGAIGNYFMTVGTMRSVRALRVR